MKRMMMGAVFGALALVGCDTTQTLAYTAPTSGPTATIVLSREWLVAEWDARMFVAEPGGAVRARLGDGARYEYNTPYTIAAGQPILLEVEDGDPEDSDSVAIVITSQYYAFTPQSGATYLVRPYKPGYNADGSIPGPLSEVRYVVVDAATRKPPADIKQQLMP